MKVELLTYTPDPEKVVASAAKLCYSKSDIETLMKGLTEEKVDSFLDKLSSMGHQSPQEHVSFTFGIEGVSRSLLAQITRHRVASFSVQSQRYVDMSTASFVVPQEIKENGLEGIFMESVNSSLNYYNKLKKILTDIYVKEGITEAKASKKAQEDARFVLPEACSTKIIMTMNARELNHFFRLRCCNRAQWEIRELATEMLRLVYPVAPKLFANAGPSCVGGTCPEGAMSCGKIATVRCEFDILKEGESK